MAHDYNCFVGILINLVKDLSCKKVAFFPFAPLNIDFDKMLTRPLRNL